MKRQDFTNFYATLLHYGFTDEVLCMGYAFINLTTKQATKVYDLAVEMGCAWVDEDGTRKFGNDHISYIYKVEQGCKYV